MKFYRPYKKEQSQIKGKLQPRVPKSKKEEAEFGPGKIDILLCEKCGSAYWYKSWHHQKNLPPKKEIRRIEYALCPACQMIKDKKYEGEIILESLPEEFKEDIKKLAENYGKRASEVDPLDRIISIKEEIVSRPSAKRKRGAISRKEFKGRRDLRILTTENQLAKRLAKKINEIYGRKFQVSISHSHEEDVARIRIKF